MKSVFNSVLGAIVKEVVCWLGHEGWPGVALGGATLQPGQLRSKRSFIQ